MINMRKTYVTTLNKRGTYMKENIMTPIAKVNVGIAATLAVATMLLSLSVTGASAASNNRASANATTSQEMSQENKESKAARDFRIALSGLLQDHVTTNISVNRSIASGASTAEINAGIQAQVANADQISAAIASIYGPEAGAQFSEMFLEHIEESNNFATAVAAGDEMAKEAANEELQEYLEEIATFFSTAIPVLPYDAVYGLLLEHETLINQSTEALTDRNFGQSKKYEQQALRQVNVIADALASGIIETQPDKF